MARHTSRQGDPSRARPCRASAVQPGAARSFRAYRFDGAVDKREPVLGSSARPKRSWSGRFDSIKTGPAPDLSSVGSSRSRQRPVTHCRAQPPDEARGGARSLNSRRSFAAAPPPTTVPACQDGTCAFCPARQGRAGRTAISTAFESSGPYRERGLEDSKVLVLVMRQEKGPGLLRGPGSMILA
jgi:hypothetical protein